MTLDIIIPCYNESECIVPLYNAISRVLNRINIEWTILFINDGSQDDTLDKIKTLLQTTMKEGRKEGRKIYFFLKEFWKRSRNIRRLKRGYGRLCCVNGCRFTASSLFVERND